MKTEIKQKTYLIDAKDKILGRLATDIANILRGKDKVSFVPYKCDLGDDVVVINAKKIKLTGKKAESKVYYHHSGYPGGLKEEKIGKLFAEKPEQIIKKAVYGMLPKNKLRDQFIKKLKIFADESYKEKGGEVKM